MDDNFWSEYLADRHQLSSRLASGGQTKRFGPRPRISTRQPRKEPAMTPAPADVMPVLLDARCTYKDCLRGNDKGEYKVTGYCTNCRTEPIIGTFTVGHEASGGVLGKECPVCGCKRLGWRGPA